MTTRGIINGSDTFGIRSVRGERYKYILNFTPQIEFRNACTKSREFKSWIAARLMPGTRMLLTRCVATGTGQVLRFMTWKKTLMNGITSPVKRRCMRWRQALRAKLDAWMRAQGDKGQATELAARDRQGGGRKKKGKRAGKKDKESGLMIRELSLILIGIAALAATAMAKPGRKKPPVFRWAEYSRATSRGMPASKVFRSPSLGVDVGYCIYLPPELWKKREREEALSCGLSPAWRTSGE